VPQDRGKVGLARATTEETTEVDCFDDEDKLSEGTAVADGTIVETEINADDGVFVNEASTDADITATEDDITAAEDSTRTDETATDGKTKADDETNADADFEMDAEVGTEAE
jgi:hypothetical protein